MYVVRVGGELARQITDRFGPERSAVGSGSAWDFWSGPLANALIGFRAFDRLPREELPGDDPPVVRHLHLTDPVFGVVVFFGVLTEPGVVELVLFADDPDYWTLIEDDPDD